MSNASPTGNDLIRVGRVSAVYEQRLTVRVEFPDRSGLISKELPVLVPLTLKNHAYALPDPGEHVVCVFLDNGISEGFVFGAIYDGKNPPPCMDKDRYYIEFEGGAHILADRREKTMQIRDFYGSFIKFEKEDIILQSKHHIHLNPHNNPEIPLGPLPGAAHVASTLGGE